MVAMMGSRPQSVAPNHVAIVGSLARSQYTRSVVRGGGKQSLPKDSSVLLKLVSVKWVKRRSAHFKWSIR